MRHAEFTCDLRPATRSVRLRAAAMLGAVLLLAGGCVESGYGYAGYQEPVAAVPYGYGAPAGHYGGWYEPRPVYRQPRAPVFWGQRQDDRGRNDWGRNDRRPQVRADQGRNDRGQQVRSDPGRNDRRAGPVTPERRRIVNPGGDGWQGERGGRPVPPSPNLDRQEGSSR